MKTLTLVSLTTAALLSFAMSQSAVAGVTSSKAVSACKTEVAARYGENAKTKVHRIRNRKVTTVSLSVRGVTEKSFKVDCKIDGRAQIAAFTDSRDDSVATR